MNAWRSVEACTLTSEPAGVTPESDAASSDRHGPVVASYGFTASHDDRPTVCGDVGPTEGSPHQSLDFDDVRVGGVAPDAL